jgi:MoxR-like ATPase
MSKAKTAERQSQALPLGPLVKDVLRLAFRAKRAVLLEGPTGIGKSEIVAQVAAELGVHQVVLDLSLLEPPDLVGLPVIAEGRTAFAAPRILPTDGAGILLLEELNRAERYIQQPALQLLTGRRLHEYELPPGWLACAAINPEDGDYQVTPLDPALRSRFLNLAVRADRDAWLVWAQANAVHPAVLDVARRHPRFFDGTAPRTWTYVSDLLRALRPDDLQNAPLLHAALSGYLARSWVEELLRALEESDSGDGIDLGQLLRSYHKDAALQKAVAALREQGQTDALDQLAYRMLRVVDGPRLNQLVGDGGFQLEAFERLLADLPGDHREALQESLAANRIAASLLGIKPAEILAGGYPGSWAAEQVEHWARDPLRRHRIKALVNAVGHHLAAEKDVAALQKDRGAMIGLGRFLAQLGPTLSAPLDAKCAELKLKPTMPKAK